MSFDAKTLEKHLRADNPTYEKVLRSDLRDVVSLVSKGRPSLDKLVAEMRAVKPDKWTKYKQTHAYLLSEIPGLKAALDQGALVKFRTKSLTKGPNGSIVHVLVWASSTGDLKHLKHLKVRERVWWAAPDATTKPFVDPAYAASGQHTGVGNAAFTPGDVGRGDDTHAALGPFTQKIFDLPPKVILESVLQQVYEVSSDGGGSWSPIDNSRYELRRRVARVSPTAIRLALSKTGPDKISNTHDLKT